MRPFLYVLSFLSVLALGFWAYRENYATQATLRNVAGLQDEIAALNEEIALQKAEWAYLNRPERLRELATLNFDRLGLLPMEPEQFGATNNVAFPAPPELVISGAVETQGSLMPALDISKVVPADVEAPAPAKKKTDKAKTDKPKTDKAKTATKETTP